MTRTLAALALIALLSPTAMGEPCPPRVALSGDGDVVARVAVELKQLGVALGASEPTQRSCSVTAMVVVEGEGIAVAVQNAAKRSEGRVVGDPKVAAAWIDSWLRDEIEVASWAASPATGAVGPSMAPPSTLNATPSLAGSASATVLTPTERPMIDRYGLSLGVERTWTDDDTTWDGFAIAGCARLGVTCIGGRVRAGFQSDHVFYATTADRSDIVALATASIPLTLGQISIAPELGLGVGRLRTQRVEVCDAPVVSPPNTMCDPNDPMCVTPDDPPGACFDASGKISDQQYVGDNYDKITYLPRVALAVRIAFPIVRHVWLDAVAAYALTPITGRVGFEPTTMNEPAGVAMPLEPTRGYQLGIGIRVGAP